MTIPEEHASIRPRDIRRSILVQIAEMQAMAQLIEECCEVMHDAYEAAAADAGWETQVASRRPWADVPEANKYAMRRAARALLEHLQDRS